MLEVAPKTPRKTRLFFSSIFLLLSWWCVALSSHATAQTTTVDPETTTAAPTTETTNPPPTTSNAPPTIIITYPPPTTVPPSPPPSVTKEHTSTLTLSADVTSTATASPRWGSFSETVTVTKTDTFTCTGSAGEGNGATHTLTVTVVFTPTVTVEPSPTRTAVETPTPTANPTRTVKETDTITMDLTSTMTYSATHTRSPTLSLPRKVGFALFPSSINRFAISNKDNDFSDEDRRLKIVPLGTNFDQHWNQGNFEACLSIDFSLSDIKKEPDGLAAYGKQILPLGKSPSIFTLITENDGTPNSPARAVYLQFQIVEQFYITKQQNFIIRFSKRCFKDKISDANLTVPVSAFLTQVASDVLTKDIGEGVAFGSALLSSVFTLQAATVLAPARADLILRMETCEFQFSPDGLPLYLHPTTFPIGSEPTKYYFAATIMNPTLFVAVAAIQLAVVHFIHERRRRSYQKNRFLKFSDALVTFRFPVLILAIICIFVQFAVESSLVVAVHSDGTFTVIVGSVMLSAWVVLVSLFLYRVLFRDFGATYVHYPPAHQKGEIRSAADIFFNGVGRWTDDDFFTANKQGFTEKYECLFSIYRGGRHWFILVEWAAAVAFSVIGAIRPAGHRCGGIFTALFIVAVLHLASLLVLRPFNAMYDTLFGTVVSALLAAQCLLYLIYTSTSDTTVKAVGSWAGTGLFYFMALRFLLDFSFVFARFVEDARKTVVKKKATKEDEELKKFLLSGKVNTNDKEVVTLASLLAPKKDEKRRAKMDADVDDDAWSDLGMRYRHPRSKTRAQRTTPAKTYDVDDDTPVGRAQLTNPLTPRLLLSKKAAAEVHKDVTDDEDSDFRASRIQAVQRREFYRRQKQEEEKAAQRALQQRLLEREIEEGEAAEREWRAARRRRHLEEESAYYRKPHAGGERVVGGRKGIRRGDHDYDSPHSSERNSYSSFSSSFSSSSSSLASRASDFASEGYSINSSSSEQSKRRRHHDHHGNHHHSRRGKQQGEAAHHSSHQRRTLQIPPPLPHTNTNGPPPMAGMECSGNRYYHEEDAGPPLSYVLAPQPERTFYSDQLVQQTSGTREPPLSHARSKTPSSVSESYKGGGGGGGPQSDHPAQQQQQKKPTEFVCCPHCRATVLESDFRNHFAICSGLGSCGGGASNYEIL